jgi:hypothetical protein
VQAVGKINKAEIRQLFDVLQKGYVPKKPQEQFQYYFGAMWTKNAPPYNPATALDHAISRCLSSIFAQVSHEQNFVTDLFHIGSTDDYQRWKRHKMRNRFEDLDGIREPFKDMKVRKRLQHV